MEKGSINTSDAIADSEQIKLNHFVGCVPHEAKNAPKTIVLVLNRWQYSPMIHDGTIMRCVTDPTFIRH